MFFKKTKSTGVFFLFAISLLIIPFVASAQFSVSGPSSLTDADLSVILSNIILYVIGFIGILGILFLVYGGVRYVTSGGNESDAEEAKKIITYAIWGLFICASAYAIVKTVIKLIG